MCAFSGLARRGRPTRDRALRRSRASRSSCPRPRMQQARAVARSLHSTSMLDSGVSPSVSGDTPFQTEHAAAPVVASAWRLSLHFTFMAPGHGRLRLLAPATIGAAPHLVFVVVRASQLDGRAHDRVRGARLPAYCRRRTRSCRGVLRRVLEPPPRAQPPRPPGSTPCSPSRASSPYTSVSRLAFRGGVARRRRPPAARMRTSPRSCSVALSPSKSRARAHLFVLVAAILIAIPSLQQLWQLVDARRAAGGR